MRNLICSAVLSAIIAILGCGASGLPNAPGMVIANGTATLNGTPLAFGEVSFVPIEQTAATSIPNGKFITPVTQGKFTIEVEPGKYRVEFRQFEERGGSSGPNEDETPARVSVQLLPEMYNKASELTAEVTGNGPNTFAFDLVDRRR